jgi:asparagine synthase (glutamine-hydrolysing)
MLAQTGNSLAKIHCRDVVGGGAFGYSFVSDETTSRPSAASDTGPVVLFDGRLDNEGELLGLLGFHGFAPPEVLLARGYERWAERLPEKLVGDFSVVLWDRPSRTLFAFRDPIGTRPLVYHMAGGRLVVGSDPLQILALDGVPRNHDDATIVDHLIWRFRSHEPTFFRAVKRLPPGHRLIAEPGRFQVDCFFAPPEEDRRLDRPEMVFEECRRIVLESVRDRTRGHQPILVNLSGGTDSSTIVCAARELQRRGEIQAPIYTLSARYLGLPCDEGPYIRAMVDHTGLPAVEWDATTMVPREGEDPPDADPPLLFIEPGLTRGDVAVFRRCGAHALLDGFGGDQVAGYPGVMEAIGANGAIGLAARKLFASGTMGGGRAARFRAFSRGLLGQQCPALLAVLRGVRHRLYEPPQWLSSLGRTLAREAVRRPYDAERGSFSSRSQAFTWSIVTSPLISTMLTRMRNADRLVSLERRFPLLDIRFVRFVLSLPLDYWMNHRPGRIHRDAFRGYLPSLVQTRATKVVFDEYLIFLVRKTVSAITTVLDQGPWHSEPYIDRRAVQILARATLSPGSTAQWRAFQAVSRIAALEVWLRKFPSP